MFCRCRYDGSAACALTFDASGAVVCTTAQGRKKAYDFEKLFPPDTTQEEVSAIFFPTKILKFEPSINIIYLELENYCG